MIKKFAQALCILIAALSLLSGGFVLAAGSPEAALTQLMAMAPTPPGMPQDLSAAQSAGPIASAPASGSSTANIAASSADSVTTVQTTAIRAADTVDTVSAAGNISLVERHYVVMEVDGIVDNVAVRVGDAVAAGDLLLTLNTNTLEKELKQAQLNLASAQLDLDNLLVEADAADVAAAEAELRSTQAELEDLLSPPDQRQLDAAQSNAASAWSKYQEIQAGPSEAELTRLSAELRKTEIALQEARRSYEAIAWRNDKGMTAEAAAYEKATVDYETALASYEESTAPATTSEIQSALSTAQSAQQQLEDLKNGANAANIASAEVKIINAASTLAELLAGADANDLAATQIKIEQAQLNLDDATERLAKATVIAPISGAVLSVDAQKGQRVGTGTTAVVLADTSKLELVVNVAEVDVRKVNEDLPALIRVDAFPGRTLPGIVSGIAPSSASEGGVVNYAVTIHLINADLNGIRAGMTAVATMEREATANRWMVPTVSIQEADGRAQVTVIRSGQPIPIAVTSGEIQGEWTVVTSAQLQAEDQVVGATATFLQDDLPQFGPPESSRGPMQTGG